MTTSPRRRSAPAVLSAALACTVAVAGVATLGPAASAASTDINAAPVRTLTGTAPAFFEVSGIDVGPDGRTYVVDRSSTVRVYSPGASGGAVAERTIELVGDYGFINDLEVDAAGHVYLADYTYDRVVVLGPNASGEAEPVRVIEGDKTGFAGVGALAVAADGTLHVADYNSDAVSSFAPGADGDVAPSRVVEGPNTTLDNPQGLAVDPVTGDVVVANSSNATVLVFGAGQKGDVAPKRMIGGDSTLLESPYSVDVDDAGNLYVGVHKRPYIPLTASGDDEVVDSVNVYAPGAKGDVAPVRRLVGDSTGLEFAWDVEVSADRSVHVLSYDADRVLTFAPLMPRPVVKPVPAVRPPGKVGRLRVKSAAKGRLKVVRWAKPKKTGGAAITGYHVVIRKGGKKLVDREVKGGKRVLKVRTKKLGKGKHAVAVAASSSAGTGDFVKRTFKVRRR